MAVPYPVTAPWAAYDGPPPQAGGPPADAAAPTWDAAVEWSAAAFDWAYDWAWPTVRLRTVGPLRAAVTLSPGDTILGGG
jgi:hypothetical protein